MELKVFFKLYFQEAVSTNKEINLVPPLISIENIRYVQRAEEDCHKMGRHLLASSTIFLVY